MHWRLQLSDEYSFSPPVWGKLAQNRRHTQAHRLVKENAEYIESTELEQNTFACILSAPLMVEGFHPLDRWWKGSTLNSPLLPNLFFRTEGGKQPVRGMVQLDDLITPSLFTQRHSPLMMYHGHLNLPILEAVAVNSESLLQHHGNLTRTNSKTSRIHLWP